MPAEAGGSIATTMRASGGASATRQVQPTARPQRIGALLDDLAVQLLAAKPGTGIAPDHRIEKRRREMARVDDCGGAGDRAPGFARHDIIGGTAGFVMLRSRGLSRPAVASVALAFFRNPFRLSASICR